MTEIRGQAELKKWSEILTSVSNILWQNSHLTHSDIFPLCTYCFWKINLHKIKQNLGFKDNFPTSRSCWKWHLAIKITFLRVKRSRDNVINFCRSKHKLNFTGILKYKNELVSKITFFSSWKKWAHLVYSTHATYWYIIHKCL